MCVPALLLNNPGYHVVLSADRNGSRPLVAPSRAPAQEKSLNVPQGKRHQSGPGESGTLAALARNHGVHFACAWPSSLLTTHKFPLVVTHRFVWWTGFFLGGFAFNVYIALFFPKTRKISVGINCGFALLTPTPLCCGVAPTTARRVNTMFGSPAGGIKAFLCEVDSSLLLFPFFNLSAFHPRLQFSSLVYSIIQKTLRRFEGNGLFSNPIFTARRQNTKQNLIFSRGQEKKTWVMIWAYIFSKSEACRT